MKFRAPQRMYASPPFPDDDAQPIGILLVNLGTPDAPDSASVRRYLAEFLSDRRVVERHPAVWKPLLHGIILRSRPKRSAAAYQRIWEDQGSPLLLLSQQQQQALQRQLDSSGSDAGESYRVVLAMRYGAPSIADGLQQLRKLNARRILVLPLYPQYSATTTASIFDEVASCLREWRWIPEMRFINSYATEPAYIDALAASVARYWEQQQRSQQLLLSFHGIPREYSDKGDPYADECRQTAALLVKKLELADDQWQMTYQSRLGPTQWLQPYTDATVQELASNGVKSLDVVCPGFSVDCLETLEEIAMENRDNFIHAGGEAFHYIPALNADPAHIAMMQELVYKHTRGWTA
ncbi:MAG: ferrochelatase [Pseudomonadota bacterium]